MLPSASRVAAALSVLLLAGCAPGTAGTVSVPTQPSPSPGVQVLCPAGLHVPFTLVGDASESPPAWGLDPAGRRFEIVWPPGFRARFTPDLEIVDPSGWLIARAGTVGGMGGAGDDPFYPCSFGGKVY